jgi:hypothetical protein
MAPSAGWAGCPAAIKPLPQPGGQAARQPSSRCQQCAPPLPLHSRQGWGENDRGVSYTFGPDCVADFLQKHDLDLICRAHQVRANSGGGGGSNRSGTRISCRPTPCAPPPPPGPPAFTCRRSQVVEEGYEFFAKRQLVTIFSAPNYCGEFENAGAMMSVDETLMCSFQVRRSTGCGVSCAALWMPVGPPSIANCAPASSLGA